MSARDRRQIRPVILAGGQGSRLWPLSTAACPKQFLPLFSDGSLFQQTVKRVADPSIFSEPIIVANAAHAGQIDAQLLAIGCTGFSTVLEPEGRNTAPAIALAALVADPDELLLALPSDHAIDTIETFHRAVQDGLPAAAAGLLVAFGVAPRDASTGFGYVECGDPVAERLFAATAFVEKPARPVAERLAASERHLWNTGLYFFEAGAYLHALRMHAPDIAAAAEAALAAATTDGPAIWPDERAYAAAPSISVDHAVIEHTRSLAVVRADFAWSDLGSWDALAAFLGDDCHGNTLSGNVVADAVSGCAIRSTGPIVAARGVRDLIVVATAEAVLILPRGASEGMPLLLEAVASAPRPVPGGNMAE